MTKEEFINKITQAGFDEISNRRMNSMGVSERFYNPYYLIGKCFTAKELEYMTESEIDYVLKMAQFSTDVFY